MKPKRIILVRHGESEGNVDRGVSEFKADYKLSLTERGIEQAVERGQNLKTVLGDESVYAYVSPFWRTRMTYENLIKPFSPDVVSTREDPRIREQEWGHLNPLEVSKANESARDDYGPFYYRLPDGESGADVYDRVSTFFNTLHRDFEKENYPDNTLVVSHGITIRIFLMRWFHLTVEQFEALKNPYNCQAFILNKNVDNRYDLENADYLGRDI